MIITLFLFICYIIITFQMRDEHVFYVVCMTDYDYCISFCRNFKTALLAQLHKNIPGYFLHKQGFSRKRQDT